MIRDILANDTICAIATPVGIGGIGIIRISGKDAIAIAKRLFRPVSPSLPLRSHRLHYGWIYDPETGFPVDEVLLSVMKAPRSYTREDIVEINCHSGYAVLEEILHLVIKQGARLADPGEFTYRAFLHGRIDLSQAEAIEGIISSRSRASLDLARRQLQGWTSSGITKWIDVITNILAHLEAHLDFSEDIEEEEEGLSTEAFLKSLAKQLEEELILPIEQTIRAFDSVRILREGLSLALVGKPNVGKSSLLNALLERDRAIVTEYAGTTRDVIEDSFTIDGVLVRIMDTAGIRQKADVIETMGIEKTFKAIEQVNVVLWLLDISEALSSEDDYIYQLLQGLRYIIVLNKADLPHRWNETSIRDRYKTEAPLIVISAKKREDVEALKMFIRDRFLKEVMEEATEGFAINQRHREHLIRALENISRAKHLCLEERSHFPPLPYELIAYELEAARKELNAIIGRGVSLEDVLNRVFSRFCIGK
ncbi:MAG: tRNA uridine-5-carboxymethylaminomethyl(34) synthesis GTPase MnmE [Syntrophobacterales bacterium]|nr:tRNA uridine-5-carboxymethylaminomethyl(34) synthesis GTPase MnmE [Syntrophobacterales bacterium]